MIQRVLEEFERQSVHLAPVEEGEVRELLHRYEPLLRFHDGERFFPMSALLYLLFSTIWYLPLRSREGDEIGNDPYHKRSAPSLFELLRSRPHIQLNTEVDQADFGGAPEGDRYVRLQHISPVDETVNQVRRLLESRIRRFRSAWLNPGMLSLHFAETIPPWDRRLLRHWFLPRGSDGVAGRKYDALTWLSEGRETAYYGRVVDQCGYRVVQYWFFYAFNDFRAAVRGANNHEGDWENVSIYLRPSGSVWRPGYVACSSHHDRQACTWTEVERVGAAGEHPVVYVGRGSHAGYLTAGVHRAGWGPFRTRDYALGDGEQVGPGTWGTPRLFTETEPDWLFFDGFWGAYIRDLLMRENAPRGPLYDIEKGFHRPVPRHSWYNPVAWAGLPCAGDPGCDHELHGYYSYASTDSAWQEAWGSDVEWAAWAERAGVGKD